MAEATCRRELELEIPAEEVTKKIESVAKEFEGNSRRTSREKCCNRWCRSAWKRRWRSRN